MLAGLLRLKQVCNHPAHFLGDGSPLAGRSGKLTRVEELLEEILAEGDKVLCFTQFTEWGELLAPYLARRFGDRAAVAARRRRRAGRATRWSQRFEATTGGRRCSWCRSRPAAPASTSRPRPTSSTSTGGGTRRSRTRRPTAPTASASAARCRSTSWSPRGTVEERIDEMITRKRALAERVVGTGEEWLTELSTDELRDLVALRRRMGAD